MGLCGSVEAGLSPDEKAARRAALSKSKEWDAKMNKEHRQEEAVNKLLLLGAGESGKSTLFKQMIQIYGKGFPDSEKKTYVSVIANNTISSMKTLIGQAANYGRLATESESARAFVDELKVDDEIDPRVGDAIKTLWADRAIQLAYDSRSNFQLTDSAKYFFDRIDAIMAKGYLPTDQDVLRSRVRTTGILENEFVIDGNQFKMFDVGGQRNERKKWIHCFEGVTAVIFVAAISEYDQLLYEDDKTNRMVEALQLFDEICNSRWFRDTSMILFLNKRDLFSEKITRVPLAKYFPEYTGGDNFQRASEFMQEQFESKNRNKDKRIYSHVTCATDTGNIRAVFDAVKDIVIKKSLQAAGLV